MSWRPQKFCARAEFDMARCGVSLSASFIITSMVMFVFLYSPPFLLKEHIIGTCLHYNMLGTYPAHIPLMMWHCFSFLI